MVGGNACLGCYWRCGVCVVCVLCALFMLLVLSLFVHFLQFVGVPSWTQESNRRETAHNGMLGATTSNKTTYKDKTAKDATHTRLDMASRIIDTHVTRKALLWLLVELALALRQGRE